ncbi:MAG: amidohydrolase family protein [bacterium]|nr:amidohydrolase family protein [bacterium]
MTSLRDFVNAHTHLYSGLVPFDMPLPNRAPATFSEILETIWWRLDRGLDEASLRAAARFYVSEALLAGTTAVIDHHESPNFIEGSLDVLADACDELGMRAVLCYGATERNGGLDEARRGLAENRRFLESNRRELVRGAVGVHASFTVSDETLRAAGELARELGTVVHVHVAEAEADVLDARKRGFAGPLDRLLELDALPEGSILAHGVHLSEADVARTAELGLWIIQNPRSNRGNQVGYPGGLHASRRVALGTDGYPSDPLDEAEALLVEAAKNGEPLDRATDRVHAGHALLAERFNGERLKSEIRRGYLVVDGREVVKGGRLITADVGAIREEAAREAMHLWRRVEGL